MRHLSLQSVVTPNKLPACPLSARSSSIPYSSCTTLLAGETVYLDQRSFYNPEPRDTDDSAPPPVGVGLTQVSRALLGLGFKV